MTVPSDSALPLAAEAQPSDRPNERWWLEHGGKEWLEEYQRRRPLQAHYRQQETFLQGFFLGIPPVRALDFGCGFGRHLQNLSRIPGANIYGCDISDKMVAMARARSGLPDAEERIQLIEPRGRLPFDDGFFDVVFTSEVLIHIDTTDLPQVLGELWRVARSVVLHIENPEVDASFRENDAHDGCWRHDFRAAYSHFGGAALTVLPAAVDFQTVYLISKPAGLFGEAADSSRLALIETLQATLRHERTQFLDQSIHLSRATLELDDVRRQLEQARPVSTPTLTSRLRGRLRPPSSGERIPRLPYKGFATRGSRSPKDFIADRPAVISICHPDWRGIRAATLAQERHVLEIPGIHDQKQCDSAVRFIAESGARKLVINGYPPRIDHLVVQLDRSAPNIEVFFVYHGAPAQDHPREDRVVQRMLELIDSRQVLKLGFVKAGLAEYFRSIGYPAEQVMNRFHCEARPPTPTPRSGSRWHVGVFSPNVSHKNVVTQILAGLMIPDSVVEVCEMPPVDYLARSRDRLVVHGILPHERFLRVVGQVDASLYVSHSECYPMTVLESLAAGTVCLTSHTSQLFDDNQELFEALVVSEHDNPSAISAQLQRAIERRMDLVPLAQAHLRELDARAEQRWTDFLRT
jgi:SAM-dependent methyltransferase